MTYLEYIWLDGNNPQQLRSKTKISNKKFNEFNIEKIKNSLLENMTHKLIPDWNFDGSSTNQAPTNKSELILKPVNIFSDPFRNDSLLIMCEVYNTNGSPHISNKRHNLREISEHDEESLFGFEQEYFIYSTKTEQPIGWPKNGYPKSQGEFYCSVGGNNAMGRDFIEEHVMLCHYAGLNLSGINLEVACSQAEYQIGPVNAIDGSDQFWIARYIMNKLSEKYDYYVVLHPKPYKGNSINGSGCHVNFSTKKMREDIKNKKALVIEACGLLKNRIKEHINVYGINNEDRLTGENETCSINEFKWGIGDRTASIRIPSSIEDNISQGYLEDRRPASNINPYEVVYIMIETICCKKGVKKIKSKKELEISE